MIIDCHTHCYPQELIANPREWAEANDEHHWADLVAPKDRRSIQDWATPEEMLAAMDAAGVDRVVLLGWYWENEDNCQLHNELIASWVSLNPERFIGFAAILPNKNVIHQLEAAQAMGLQGVGELHPGVQGFDSESADWQALADWCASQNWPVNFHATAENGQDHPSAVATPLQDYIRMANASPELKLILAHWGGGLPLMTDTLPDNLYFDCSASPLLSWIESFRQLIDRIGPEHVLYGSDFPLRVYPRQQRRAEMKTFLESIQNDASLTEAEKEALLGKNFERLLQKLF